MSFPFGTPQQTTQANTGFSFSATPAAGTTGTSGFSFGQSTTSTPASNTTGFGAPQPAAAAPSGFSFGAPANTTTSQPQPPLTLGTPAASTAPTFGLGSFGQTPQQSTTATAPTLSFGATATSAPSLSFGASTVTTSQQQQPTLSLGLTTTTTTTTAGFSFSQPLQTSSSLTLPTLGAGLQFGAQTTTATSTAPIITTTTVSKPVGLGGIDLNATQQKPVEGKTESGKAKENQVPMEILNTVESLKAHIKQQKSLSSDIARTTTRKMVNVQNEIQDMVWSVQGLANNVQSNKTAIKALRRDTAQVIQQTDMAQRTHETPAGLQFENTAPLQYFIDLIQKYESEMLMLKNQVELTEKHMLSLTNPQSFTPQDLKRGLQQLHESFIALAGRLYEVHKNLEIKKDQYLNLRKNLLKDKTNVFGDDEEFGGDKSGFDNISAGPTPFSNLANLSLGLNMSNVQFPGASGPSQQNTQFNMNQTGLNFSTTGTGFFNLQNPPMLGAKRNKS